MGKKNKRGVVILSGGLDSTTLTYFLKHKGYDLVALNFDYGQIFKKEISCALTTCEKLNIPLIFIKIKMPFRSALLGTDEVPPGDHIVENQKITVVPVRNMILLSYAVAFAEDAGISKVFYAAHKDDRMIYPDCRKEFVQALSNASKRGTYNKVKIYAPFIDLYKWQIVKLGIELKVPFEDTWSCYESGEKACGICESCIIRLGAFERNNCKDPIEYETNFQGE